ncbi:ABC transporter substrate-binding protein [Galenea microaerophila]
MRVIGFFLTLFFSSWVQALVPWNSPYPVEKIQQPILFSSFATPPKHLDPVVSYSANEWGIMSQIYEPPLQYAYLKRPYQLEPLTLTQMPKVIYLDRAGQEVPATSPEVVYSEYHFALRSDIRYQPHPAFVYDQLSAQQQKILAEVTSPMDFPKLGSRSLVAADYVYAIKRMAVRQNHSPILDTMMRYIVGLKAYSEKVTQLAKQQKGQWLDLRPYAISGVQVQDSRHFSIRIKGRYPQFLYWLSMNFFAPIPWEADRFYHSAFLQKKNITLDTFPVGTGPYYLAENNPNLRMRLVKNPNFHFEAYPSETEGLSEAQQQHLLKDAGKRLPFIQEVVFSLEKESVPLWNKFLQGYYDASGVSSDSFDQAIQVQQNGMQLTPTMEKKGIQFVSAVQPSIMYLAFNMQDPVVGGLSEKKRKLRQAISIALNYEEYISIFLNGRGQAAQGPIPPGIMGAQVEKYNPFVYDWKNGQPVRKSLAEAKRLLAEAGYPDGVSAKTGQPLKLYYDAIGTGADAKAQLNWMMKQFKQLGIELVIRATDYNRFQDKVRQGKVQLFSWGWNADYPDPENFLFLLYGGNGVVKTAGSGINSANYDNPEFNQLFQQMQTLPNGPRRLKIIQKMVQIAQKDAPWVWGFYPKSLTLYHHWYHNIYPNLMANNSLKYRRIDGQSRWQAVQQWNPPVLWPFAALFLLGISLVWGAWRLYQQRQQRRAL